MHLVAVFVIRKGNFKLQKRFRLFSLGDYSYEWSVPLKTMASRKLTLISSFASISEAADDSARIKSL